jgi:nitrogen fixation-related uncharacterized protein
MVCSEALITEYLITISVMLGALKISVFWKEGEMV